MNILLVQTACNYHQVVLYQNDSPKVKIIANWHQERPRETLSFLMKVLAELEQFPKADLLVFVQGPGSFTALRVGATWVNTMAYVNQTPIVTINSLQYLACLTGHTPDSLALTFDQRRYFTQIDGQVIASEQTSCSHIINPDQTPMWFQEADIPKLSPFFSPKSEQTDVLYVVPPKITQPRPK